MIVKIVFTRVSRAINATAETQRRGGRHREGNFKFEISNRFFPRVLLGVSAVAFESENGMASRRQPDNGIFMG
jgi:hypothetical protein